MNEDLFLRHTEQRIKDIKEDLLGQNPISVKTKSRLLNVIDDLVTEIKDAEEY
ncbi:hypothetical protein [Clostridium niameyense]|uniref:hypothetical protein n=1 Tax=Clostridium niameyense TaxID=1622073 RepID=UPI0013D57E47|nr:hypothetical protein [Clostridium niameyense]